MKGSASSNRQFHQRRATTPTWSSYASSMGNATEVKGLKALHCHCGRRVIIRVSKTDRNPGRPFYSCCLPKDDELNCKFFAWVDQDCDDVAHDGKDMEELWRMRLSSQLEGMHSEIRGLKYVVTLMCICLLVLVIVAVFWIKLGT
ncbi:Zinc finger, GRF-type [Sesbania bispinosa]|nr:Zinc finger, GRF-type [Sesbania bispinosa]